MDNKPEAPRESNKMEGKWEAPAPRESNKMEGKWEAPAARKRDSRGRYMKKDQSRPATSGRKRGLSKKSIHLFPLNFRF